MNKKNYEDYKYDKFKIVKIIDDYTVLIDAGKQDGYDVGDVFEIYITGKEIKSPSGDVLGTLDNIKGQIVVDTIFDAMSLCKSSEFTASGISASMEMFNTTLYSKSRKKLNVDPSQITPVYSDIELEIKIGDDVRFSRQQPTK